MRNLLAIAGFLYCLWTAFDAGQDWHLHNYHPPIIFQETHKEPLSKDDIKKIEAILRGRGLIANVDLNWSDGKLYLGEVEGYEDGSISHFEAIGITMKREIDDTLYGEDSKLRVQGTFNPVGAIVYKSLRDVGPFQQNLTWKNAFSELATGFDICDSEHQGRDCPPTLNSTGGMLPIEVKGENWK